MEHLTKAAAYKMNLNQVRLVGEGQNEFVTIQEAFRRSDDLGLDLVLVSATTTPPVVRIQDFKKLEYEKKKARKSSKPLNSVLKEIQFKINISDHDLATKLSKINEFLQRGDKVKISVRLKGREKENPDRAYQLIQRVASSVDCKVNPIAGPMAMVILEPLKAAPKIAKPSSPTTPATQQKSV